MARVEISKKLVLINSASSVVAMVLNISVLIWLQQYLIKRISPEEFSLLPVIMSVMLFEPLITTVLTGGLGRFITVAYARGDDGEVTRIVSTMFPILCLAGLALLVGGLVLAWHIGSILNIVPERLSDARIMLALLVCIAAIRLPAAPFGSGFMVRQKLMLQDMIDMGCQLVRLAVLFSLLFGVSTRVLWVVVASVSSELLKLMITVPISMRLVPAQRVRASAIHWPLVPELTSYGGWSFVNEIANTIKNAMDPLLLNRFASPVDVACFHVGGLGPRQLGMLAAPLARPLIPVFAGLYATGDTVRMRNTYLRMCRYRTWPILLVAAPAIVFSSDFMRLYIGEKYAMAGPVMALLIAARLVVDLNSPTRIIAGACGALRGFALRQVATHSLNLALTLWLVVCLGKGALGSALATLAATAVLEPLLMWPFGWRLAETTLAVWLKEAAIPSLLPAVPAIGLCLFLKAIFGVPSWAHLIGYSGLAAAVYVVFLARYCLRDQDRLDVRSLIAKAPAGRIRRVLRGLVFPLCGMRGA